MEKNVTEITQKTDIASHTNVEVTALIHYDQNDWGNLVNFQEKFSGSCDQMQCQGTITGFTLRYLKTNENWKTR